MNSKIVTIVALFVGLLIAMSLAVQVGQGEFKTVYIITLLIVCIPVVLMLGLRSWYSLPFAMLAGLPAIPLFAGRNLQLSEFVIALMTAMVFAETLNGKIKLQMKYYMWFPILSFVAWMIVVAIANGGGLAILGASQIGGRRYITVIAAMIGMIVISQINIQEKEARRVIWIMFIAMSLTGIYSSITAYIGISNMAAGVYTNDFYSWHQGLSLIAMGGVLALFARVSPKNVILNPLYALTYILLLSLAAFSGKRMGFAACCIVPIVACFWHKQKALAVVAVMGGMLFLVATVFIQNSTGLVPKGLQRTLQFLPADWHWEVERSAVYSFRETLNKLAIEKIRESPVLGDGVVMNFKDHMVMEDQSYVAQIMDPDDDPQAYPHAAAKNWHSTWIGLAAIMGIPGSFIWIIVQFTTLRRSWKLGRSLPYGSWTSSLAAMVFLGMFLAVMRSWSSGDIAQLALEGSLFVGLLCAIQNGEASRLLEMQHQDELENQPVTNQS
jgi:hypothetical protein